MKTKGSSVIRARKWGLQEARYSRPSTKAAASTTAPVSLIPPLPRRTSACSTAPLPTGDDSSSGITSRFSSPLTPEIEGVSQIGRTSAAVLHPSSETAMAPAEVAHQQLLMASPPSLSTSGSPAGDEHHYPTGDASLTLLQDEASTPSAGIIVEDPASENSQARPDYSALLLTAPQSDTRERSPNNFPEMPSSPPTSPALTAALACARGIGGRLGTPLGSPYPAPGGDWAAGCSASAAACAAARIARRSKGGIKSSAPGSRFFPPFAVAGAPAISPVVFEMVQDAADDEEDAAAAAAAAGAGDSGAATRGEGWQGLMLYRWAGSPII